MSIGVGLFCLGVDDGFLKIWDMWIVSLVMSLVGGYEDSVKCCVWFLDGSYIVFGVIDSKVKMFFLNF